MALTRPIKTPAPMPAKAFLAILFIRNTATKLKASDSKIMAIAGFIMWMLAIGKAKSQTSSSLNEAETIPIPSSILGFL